MATGCTLPGYTPPAVRHRYTECSRAAGTAEQGPPAMGGPRLYPPYLRLTSSVRRLHGPRLDLVSTRPHVTPRHPTKGNPLVWPMYVIDRDEVNHVLGPTISSRSTNIRPRPRPSRGRGRAQTDLLGLSASSVSRSDLVCLRPLAFDIPVL